MRIKTVGDLTKPMVAMLEDVRRAEEDLDRSPADAYCRRAFIRAQFAAIEGCIYLLKQTALAAVRRSNTPLTLDEHCILSEKNFRLDDTGKILPRPENPKLPANFKFTVDIINRLFGSSIAINPNKSHWSDLQNAIKVRNRIMHPKGLMEFGVSDAEINACRRMGDGWLHELLASLVSSSVDGAKKAKSGVNAGS